MDKLDKLNKIISIANKQAVKVEDVKKFIDFVLKFVKEEKDSLSNGYTEKIEEALNAIQSKSDISFKELDNKGDVIISMFLEAKELLESIKNIKSTHGKDGKDYILTEKDKTEIASFIEVPIVEKIIEKTTEKVIEKVENEITGNAIVDLINDLPLEEDQKIDASHIKNLPEFRGGKFYGGSGIKEIVAGTNITVDNTNLGYPVINSTGSSETFESVSKNLKSYPYQITYSGGAVDTITYDLGGGLEIVKTFGYTSGDVTTVTLSGDTPSGIDLIKTIAYSGGNVDFISYS